MVSILKALIGASSKKNYGNVPTSSWWTVLEPFSGAWQRNVEWTRETVLANHSVFACTSLISADISKLQINLVREDDGIWEKIPFGNFSVLENPNNYQNRIQFFENWIVSKLTRGNTYVLKGRSSNGIVTKLYVLCPDFVLPLVSDNGEVFYQLSQDNLSGIRSGGVTVPASEIIHDRFNCLYHPLVGLPPLYACGLSAFQGLKIQENSAKFFRNMSRPSGILTAPGAISPETAARLKTEWQANYSADNIGNTAVLGDDMKYEALSINAEQSQLVEQLKLSAEIVCSAFHVPKYKVIGDPPSYNNIEALEIQYYSQCLQKLIEDIELALDRGLSIPAGMGTEFDLDGLLRMDSAALYESNNKGVAGGWFKPDEARRRVNLRRVEGGNTPYLQQQNYSLAALAKRDALDDPFAKSPSTSPNPGASNNGGDNIIPNAENADDDMEEKMLIELGSLIKREIEGIQYA